MDHQRRCFGKPAHQLALIQEPVFQGRLNIGSDQIIFFLKKGGTHLFLFYFLQLFTITTGIWWHFVSLNMSVKSKKCKHLKTNSIDSCLGSSAGRFLSCTSEILRPSSLFFNRNEPHNPAGICCLFLSVAQAFADLNLSIAYLLAKPTEPEATRSLPWPRDWTKRCQMPEVLCFFFCFFVIFFSPCLFACGLCSFTSSILSERGGLMGHGWTTWVQTALPWKASCTGRQQQQSLLFPWFSSLFWGRFVLIY